MDMEGLHGVLLVLHGLLRWVVLGLGLLALARTLAGAQGGKRWQPGDTKLVRFFTIAFDTEVLLGLVLWLGVSPLGVRMFGQPGVMKQASLRFFMVEHVVGMLVAVALLHVLTARARRLGDDPARYKKTAIGIAAGFAVLALSIPWPFMAAGRPLLRL